MGALPDGEHVPSADRIRDLDAALAKITQLETALQSRVVIEQAKGMLAERLNVDVDSAFSLLRRAARSHRLKVQDLARAVVEQPRTPQPLVIAIAQEMVMRGAWMREYAEAQRERVDALRRQIAEQMRVAREQRGRA